MDKIKFEEITFSGKVPLRVFMYALGFVEMHWHKTTELIMVLEGNLLVRMENTTHTLGPTDVLLINRGEAHELRSEHAVIVSIQLNLSQINHFEENMEQVHFNCNSQLSQHPELFDGVRFAFAVLIRQNMWNPKYIDYQNYSICYYLIADLLRYFQDKPLEITGRSTIKTMHLSEILNYIDAHYAEDLTLAQIAETEKLSPSYVSSLFAQYLDTTFLNYYTRLRLVHAKEDLTHTEASIEEIAKNNGFSEIHTFTRRFKQEFQMLPSTFRKNLTEQERHNYGTLSYLDVDPKNYLELTEKYVVMLDYSYSTSTKPLIDALTPIPVDCTNVLAELKHTYCDIITVPSTADLLDRNTQETLTDFQNTIHASYIKLIDLFSDRVILVSQEKHRLQCNFYLLDGILDYVLSTNAKPYICLSYIPHVFSSNAELRYWNPAPNIHMPDSFSAWASLVTSFINHIIHRFGIREVETWCFGIWDGDHADCFEKESVFFRFYRNTYRIIRQILPSAKIGSPSLSYMPGNKTERFFRHFQAFCRENNFEPDFLDFKYYAYSEVNPVLNDRKDDFSLWVGSLRKMRSSSAWKDIPVYITEYGFSSRQDILIQDTCYQSCYLIKNMLANYDRLDAYGCGNVSDFSHTYQLKDNLFHGGNGLYSVNGLKKSAYYAYAFLRELGNQLIAAGDGYFVTKTQDCYRVITYNYVHYHKGFRPESKDFQQGKNRYHVFDTSRGIQLTLMFQGITPGNYEIRDYFINQEYGSAYDIWVRQGSEILDSRDTEYLKAQCVPGFKKTISHIDSTNYTHQFVLEPLEIRLTEIKYIS